MSERVSRRSAKSHEPTSAILPAPDIITRIMAYQEVREHSHRELAHKLDLEGLRDSNGEPWTAPAVKAVLFPHLVGPDERVSPTANKKMRPPMMGLRNS